MQYLKHTGDGYSGWDPHPKRNFTVSADPDEIMEVSDQKAEQLLDDFPGDWEKTSKKAYDAQFEADEDTADEEQAEPEGKDSKPASPNQVK